MKSYRAPVATLLWLIVGSAGVLYGIWCGPPWLVIVGIGFCMISLFGVANRE